MCKAIGKAAVILLAGVIMGTALLWLSYLLPITEGSTHVAESVDMLRQEGWYPSVPLMYQYTGQSSSINPGGILDNFTDSIMIGTAGHAPVDGALYQAMNMDGGMEGGYSYYWHGYVAILRPLLLFMNYADMRVVNQLLQILLVTALAGILYRQKGKAWAALAVTVYGLLLPMAVSQALQYSWVFYIGICGSLAVVRFHEWLAHKQRLYLFFMVLGMLTCYMDLLTYPLFTWGIPMIWWIVMEDDRSEKKRFLTVVLCGIAWIGGYGGLWIGKWLIGGIILHKPILTQGWREVQYRAGMLPDTDGDKTSHWKVIMNNLGIFQSVQGIFILGGWILWWAWQTIRRRRVLNTAKTPALLLVAVSPVVWYIVLHNHTYVHSSYTYRIWAIGLTAMLALVVNSLDTGTISPRSAGKYLPSAAITLIAVIFAFLLKEDTYIHNGNFVPTQLELKEHMEITQVFTPARDFISSMNLLLSAETGLPGNIEVELLESGHVLWNYSIPTYEVEGGKFYELPSKLYLKKGTSYQLRISGSNLENGRIFVGVTDQEVYPLAELSAMQIDNQEYHAQLICGIRYRHRAKLRKIVFAIELQLLLYWSIYLIAQNIIRKKKISPAGDKSHRRQITAS